MIKQEILEEAMEIAGDTDYAYLATSRGGQPRIRPIKTAWDSGAVWIAGTTNSPKMREITRDNRVELFWHLTDKLRHLTVTGKAEVVTDAAEKKRMWDVFDFDLAAYYPEGPESAKYGLMRIEPSRVECWALPEIYVGSPPRVWKG